MFKRFKKNPKRIDKILNEIGCFWKANPEMRFVELLIDLGIVSNKEEDFDMEDYEVTYLLKKNRNILKKQEELILEDELPKEFED